MNDQAIIVLGMLVQFLTGFLAHKVGSEKLRKFIPIGTMITSILTQVLASFQSGLPPVLAPVHPALAVWGHTPILYAGFFGTFGKGFLDIFVNALLQTLIVTGAHSAPKNVMQGIKLLAAAAPATPAK